jgi:S1-C subfamily serine protease
MSIVVDHGNSGGALYDDEGRLVGITTHLTQCTNDQYCEGRASSLEAHVLELLQ